MKKALLTAAMSAGLLFTTATPGMAIVPRHRHYYYHHHYHTRAAYIRHRRHMKTFKRVGIGAAGGAAIGAIAGGGKGAGIGALVGGGAGYLYDRHQKHHGHY